MSAADAAQRSECWHETLDFLLRCPLHENNADLTPQPPQTRIIRSMVMLHCEIAPFEV